MHPFDRTRSARFLALTLAGMTCLPAANAEQKPPAPAAAPAAAATPAPPARPAKITLAYKAKVGQVTRRKSDGTFKFEAGGQKMTVEAKEVGKTTVTAVAPSGDITLEREVESSETTFNGQKAPDDGSKDKETITIRPDGTLVSYKTTEDDKAQAKTAARMFVATWPVFSKTAVGVGDKWSQEFKADAQMGTEAGKADFEVVAFEKSGGVDAVKIKMTYAETGASPNITGGGFVWVETSSGDSVVSEYDIENLPVGEGEERALIAGKMRDERTEGGLLTNAAVAKDGEKKPEPKKEKTIDELVKEFEKLPGVLTLYRKRESGKDTIYAELREDQLGKLMMLQTTASTGTSEQVVAGDPISDLVFKFVKSGDERILLVTPNIAFRANDKKPIARAVRRSFADAYLESFKVEAQQAERKSLLINVSDLFRGDLAQIGQYFSASSGAPGGYSMDRDKTFVTSVKNFPENLVVETQYHFTRGGARPGAAGGATLADPRSAPFKVNYTLFPLPENGYHPRLADGRVGYFVTEYQNFDDDSRDDMKVRYIYRWNVEKADPSAKVSAPKKPIVFWLDNAIPTEYRPAVRDGLLMWNKAFLKIGIKDAIVVKQMPDDADWDHADMRYNTIRWVASPDAGYAVALFRVNPLTGQILNANITVDANMTRYLKLERKNMIEPSAAFDAGAGVEASSLKPSALATGARRYGLDDPRHCTLAAEKREQAWFGYTALSLLAPLGARISETDYINGFLREVVAHEMGHIMGLRHNFIASTESTLDELKNPARVQKLGITSSVMDYNAFNVSALKTKGVDFYSQTIGTYDTWAIEYGYTPIPGAGTPEAELPKLKQIARKTNVPGHAYQSDEIADQFDPLVARFDLGKDPLAYWARMLQTSRYLLVNLDKRMPKNGESYWEFTKAFGRLLNVQARAAGTASRYIGGLHVNRNYKGDVGEKPTLVPTPAAKQKEALALLNTYVFSPTAFSFPDRYYTKLTSNPNGFESFGATQDFPVRDQIAGIQRVALRRLFAPAVLGRVANNEFKMGGDPARALTMPYLFNSVGSTVWTELGAKQNIPTLRRQLQRNHLDTMIEMFVKPGAGTPEDAKMLAWDQLRQLKTRIAAAKAAPALDTYTRVHLDEALNRVNRTLDAKVMIGGAEPTGASLLQMLLGAQAQAAEQKP